MILLILLFTTGCAYRIGRQDRRLPGDYNQVYVQMFKNLTFEPGAEVPFSNALIYEFERSKAAQNVDRARAQVEVIGVIEGLKIEGKGLRKAPAPGEPGPRQPLGTVVATAYNMVLNVKVSLRRISDQKILWESTFTNEANYAAPLVMQGGLNTVNPLYNQSARRQNIETLASQMMSEAHDRMTENF